MSGTAEIDGYQDIHHNMRFWITTLADILARAAENGQPTGPTGAAETGQPTGPTGAAGESVVVYDIGANDGELTLPLAGSRLADGRLSGGEIAAEKTRLPVQVVAFEPQPAARARLMARAAERNLSVALWGTADLTVVPVALGDRDDLIELHVFTDDTFSSLHSRPTEELERYSLQVVETVTTRMRPLDDLVSGGVVPPPHLVKIDVEGAERAVLAGARETLSRYHPPVLVEFSCPNSANAGYDRMEIVDFLRAAGYDRLAGLFRNQDHALYPDDAFDDCRIWNILAVSSGQTPTVTVAMDQYHAPWGGSS
ncbi:MAG: FkbM family methyltransferase [Alkalispirochaeta sp.]